MRRRRKVENENELVKCLKCGKRFKGSKFIRFCKKCKRENETLGFNPHKVSSI